MDLSSRIEDKQFVCQLVDIVRELNTRILAYYEDPALWRPQRKADASPVTAADLMAHSYLQIALQELLPEVPFLSEEGQAIPFETRKAWQYYWLVDPLDGTQEFLNRSDEFSVNIALIHQGEPILGVLGLPVLDKIYVGVVGQGARCWEQGKVRDLPTLLAQSEADVGRSNEIASEAKQSTILAVSRRRGGECAKALAEAIGSDAPWCQLGGALKFCEMAEGRAHIYPRFSPVCEWDVAAGHALIRSLGAEVYQVAGEPFEYNCHECLHEVYFCACSPGLSDTVLPEWARLLTDGA